MVGSGRKAAVRWTAEGADERIRVFRDGEASVMAGDMMVSRRAHGTAVRQGGTANLHSSLTDSVLSGFFYPERQRRTRR